MRSSKQMLQLSWPKHPGEKAPRGEGPRFWSILCVFCFQLYSVFTFRSLVVQVTTESVRYPVVFVLHPCDGKHVLLGREGANILRCTSTS